jgi:hypothetical protein
MNDTGTLNRDTVFFKTLPLGSRGMVTLHTAAAI